MRIKLSEKWIKCLLSMPESGMGYQTVDIVLKNGSLIKKINVFNAEDLELPDEHKDIKIGDIVNIRLHRKKIMETHS